MDAVKRFYDIVCKMEETLATAGLIVMTLLILLSAAGRSIGHPLNWAVDISLLLFSWVSFMGADVGIRQNRIINVDFLTSRFSLKTQKKIFVLWSVIIILFLVILIIYGIPLCISNAKRQFQNITLSYSYVTASLPVCSFFMIVSMSIKLKKQLCDFPSTLKSIERDSV
ncbi:MAG: TRAP transporter small permease subunit [Synergistaceae bacterium]|jgi:TRAP-type C4-dicarboxylate transport system permease small subunit|nr:TRAP transporter small permease subunit [Synergistaceae bacterium]